MYMNVAPTYISTRWLLEHLWQIFQSGYDAFTDFFRICFTPISQLLIEYETTNGLTNTLTWILGQLATNEWWGQQSIFTLMLGSGITIYFAFRIILLLTDVFGL